MNTCFRRLPGSARKKGYRLLAPAISKIVILIDFAKRAFISTCLKVQQIAISLLRFCKIYYVKILYDLAKRAFVSTICLVMYFML